MRRLLPQGFVRPSIHPSVLGCYLLILLLLVLSSSSSSFFSSSCSSSSSSSSSSFDSSPHPLTTFSLIETRRSLRRHCIHGASTILHILTYTHTHSHTQTHTHTLTLKFS